MTAKNDEIVQIVDLLNRKTEHRPRSAMRRERLIHRASFILVFNDHNQLFLQKRTSTKDIYPGCWDIAAGGVVLADESYEDSAKRELFEELGIVNAPLTYLGDHYHEDAQNRVWGRIFTCRHNGPFVLQETEVESGMFLSIKDALRLKNHQPFTPDGMEILEKIDKHGRFVATPTFFLHGLDSSGQGTKGQFFKENYPHIHCPDFAGSLEKRLQQLTTLCRELSAVVFIGSSFGGLMATCFALQFPAKVTQLILLAPALNFEGFFPPKVKLTVPSLLVIGKNDTVTPPAKVIPLAQATFTNLAIRIENDDHLLRNSFVNLDWGRILQP